MNLNIEKDYIELNDLNYIKGIQFEEEYEEYEINKNEQIKLSEENQDLDEIIKKQKHMNNLNGIVNLDGINYKVNKKKVFDHYDKEIGKYVKGVIKFNNIEKHNLIKSLLETNKRLEENKQNILHKIKTTDIQLNKIEKEYKNLPDLNNENMNMDIYNKVEYNTNIIKNTENCDKQKFKLKPLQIFLKNFISKNTLYNSILLFHGTGTGKTCSGVTIAENFNNNKTIILCPTNIIQNWKDTIYDNTKGNNQCTGDLYNDKILDKKNITNETRSIIKKNYEISGYRKFSNKIVSELDLDLSSIGPNEKKKIRDRFNNKLIIIDEVHNIRDEKDTKDIMKLLKIIVETAFNIKLILLSATPMFNNSSEIVNIINLMLLNDKRISEKLKKKDIFTENGDLIQGLNENGENPSNILNKILRGYISYSRGENNATFPLRLYPKQLVLYPDFDYKGMELNDNKLSFVKLYGSELDVLPNINPYGGEITQSKVYYKELEKVKSKSNLQIDDEIKFMQISNMVYPSNKYFTGDMGLKSTMNVISKENHISYSYRKQILDKHGPIFSQENIGKYSKKIKNIIDIVKKSEGIVFIYSQYIKSGIIPLAFALEQAGYSKFNSEPILSYDKKHTPLSYDGTRMTSKNKSSFKKGNYIILSSSEKLSSNMIEELKISKMPENNRGQNIKIILGTSVASEGLDFKNIRMIHIMDPWHHLNRLEQVVGRGIRYCSHIELPKEDRNVMVYLHVTQNANNIEETTDISIYRYAEKKAINIGEIELILKKNSIDCNLFNKPEDESGLITCNLPERNKDNNIEQVKISGEDQPFSKICSYSSDCSYKCSSTIKNSDKEKEKNLDTLDISLFKPVLYELTLLIKKFYEFRISYSIEEIIDKLKKMGVECINEVIYLAMKIMITEENDNTILEINGNKGYINYIGDQYIFKPSYIEDPNTPFVYRYMKKKYHPKYIDIKTKQRIHKPKIVKPIKLDLIDINIDTLKTYFSLGGLNYINRPIDEKYMKFYIIDRLTLSVKESYLNNIIRKLHEKSKLVNDDIFVYEHFQRNLIYNGKDVGDETQEYIYDIEIKRESGIIPIGYYLYNGTTFIYTLYIDGKPVPLDKNDERSDAIKKWLHVWNTRQEYIDRYINKINNKIWSYIFTNTKKQYLFKLVDKDSNSLPGFRAKGHKDCNGQQTSDISSDILIELNKIYKKDIFSDDICKKLFGINKKEPEKGGCANSNSKGKNGGVTRSVRCIYLELIMRELGLLFNYDNMMMMKI